MTTTTIEKMLDRAADYEQKAAALRIAAAEMNGHALDSKQATLGATVAKAIKVRKQQRPRVAASEPLLSKYAATKRRRAQKAERIVEILRDHGKPMKLADLATIAKDTGIDGLTGIHGLVKKGLLVSRGKGVRRTYSAA